MSMNVNQDYSQFYVGTEQLKSYGSNPAAKKDALIKYRFNTTDEHGNKVMDKMSREETLQAMKDIRSQYGNDAIVEFSGDGMAALVESKKSGNGADLDKIMAKKPGQQVVPEDMITHLEGTYRIVSADDEINKHVGWHDTLKEKAPDVCGELDDLMQNILDHAINHSGDGEKFGARFVELVQKAEKAISAYDAKKESIENTVGETQLSEKAQALLKKLRETYGDMDFFAADFSKGDNAKDILSKAGKEFSVILTVEELEKMASDEKYEKEYMEKVQGARRMSEQISKEYGAISVSGEAARTKVNKIGISINEDGTTTFFAELEKASQQQRERIESAREEKLAERKNQAGQTMVVQADSIEELIERIKEVNWDKAAE